VHELVNVVNDHVDARYKHEDVYQSVHTICMCVSTWWHFLGKL